MRYETSNQNRNVTAINGLVLIALHRWIIGLPRTGSTWLHKMLGSDPSGRALRSWEIKYPVPLEDCETGSKEERQAKVKAQLGILYKLAPRIRHIHYVEALDPDEDVAGFLDASMVDWFAWGMVAMEETYAWYVDGQNSKPQYANYRKLVQCLLHQDDPKEAANRSHLVFKVSTLTLSTNSSKSTLETLISMRSYCSLPTISWPYTRSWKSFQGPLSSGCTVTRFKSPPLAAR